jgi:hypothetical protein
MLDDSALTREQEPVERLNVYELPSLDGDGGTARALDGALPA